jgi:hypothetical protein
MKQTLIILVFILTTKNLFVCSLASQYRLFPLGQTSKGLCVVETHLSRTEFIENENKNDTINDEEIEFEMELGTRWVGISYFKIYDVNHKEVYTEMLDTIMFEENNYDSIVDKTFQKGLKLVEKYPDFVVAKPISLTFCDYGEKCSKAKLLFDTINNKIHVQLQNKAIYNIKTLFDSTSIVSNFLKDYVNGFDDIDISAKSFIGQLHVNSVRQFQIGSKKLTIVHIGTGQFLELADGRTPSREEYKAKFAFTDINKSVFEEPVLHHGHGFDFYMWE